MRIRLFFIYLLLIPVWFKGAEPTEGAAESHEEALQLGAVKRRRVTPDEKGWPSDSPAQEGRRDSNGSSSGGDTEAPHREEEYKKRSEETNVRKLEMPERFYAGNCTSEETQRAMKQALYLGNPEKLRMLVIKYGELFRDARLDPSKEAELKKALGLEGEERPLKDYFYPKEAILASHATSVDELTRGIRTCLEIAAHFGHEKAQITIKVAELLDGNLYISEEEKETINFRIDIFRKDPEGRSLTTTKEIMDKVKRYIGAPFIFHNTNIRIALRGLYDWACKERKEDLKWQLEAPSGDPIYDHNRASILRFCDKLGDYHPIIRDLYKRAAEKGDEFAKSDFLTSYMNDEWAQMFLSEEKIPEGNPLELKERGLTITAWNLIEGADYYRFKSDKATEKEDDKRYEACVRKALDVNERALYPNPQIYARGAYLYKDTYEEVDATHDHKKYFRDKAVWLFEMAGYFGLSSHYEDAARFCLAGDKSSEEDRERIRRVYIKLALNTENVKYFNELYKKGWVTDKEELEYLKERTQKIIDQREERYNKYLSILN